MDSQLDYDKLIADGPNRTFNNIPLKVGETGVRGEVVGFETSTGTLRSYESGGAGGVEIPYGIVVDSTDATSAQAACSVYVFGGFKTCGLTFSGSGDTATVAFINLMRNVGIYIKASLSSVIS